MKKDKNILLSERLMFIGYLDMIQQPNCVPFTMSYLLDHSEHPIWLHIRILLVSYFRQKSSIEFLFF